MATGRADFWYGRPFLLTDTPDEFNTEDAPTANWAYNHAVNSSAHHVRYSDTEAVLAMGTIGNTNPLNHNRYNNGEAQEAMGVKANYNPYNHDRYTDANAQAACWPVYIARGDPAAEDFDTNDFTKDNLWRDLNLSGIVPAGAQAVLLGVYIQATAAAADVRFKRKGMSNNWAVSGLAVPVANQPIMGNLVVSLDSNRVCEYKMTTHTWTYLYVTIVGWWK